MKRQTRAFLLNIATGIAITAAAALMLLPTAASAATAYTTTDVNVRSSAGGEVIFTLSAGTAVDVLNCEGGWCSIMAPRGPGFVSERFLSTTADGPGGSFSFGITGPNGNTIEFGVNVPGDDRPPVRPPVEEESACDFDQAGFFSRSQRRGESFCVAAGDYIPDLGGWAGEISSIDNPDRLEVTVCTRTNLRGDCRTYTTSANSLGRFDNTIRSLSVD